MWLEPSSPVWYVAYGSNLSAARFGCYLAGGRPSGAARSYVGARDRRLPQRAVPLRLPGRIRFAGVSGVWTGSLAFYDPGARGEIAARGYLVTFAQLSDVVAQETRQPVGTGLELGPARPPGQWPTGSGVYESLIHLGALDEQPMLTITSTQIPPPAPPSAAYLRTILAGLAETFSWSDAERVGYLLQASGVTPSWSRDQLLTLCQPDVPGEPDIQGGGKGTLAADAAPAEPRRHRAMPR